MANTYLALACSALLASSLALPASAWAQDETFVPETISAKATVDPGPKVFVNVQNWSGGPSVVRFYSADDLSVVGTADAGAQSHFAISQDGKAVYIVSGYYSRLSSGTGEHVLRIFDVDTASLTKEIVLPLKVSQYTDDASLMQLSADEKYLYVQNATPATSVTVVDLQKGEVVQEVPSPGCFGIYPTLEGHAYSTICGDGTFTTMTLSADGTSFESKKSEMIFDPEEDPIYLSFDRAGSDLLFISYKGVVHRLSDSAGVIASVSTTPIADGVEGDWGTSGYTVVSYNEANGILFLPMAPGRHDGSHYHDAEEIWAYDLANQKLLYRSPVSGISSVITTDDAVPTLFGLDIGGEKVVKFEVDPEAKFAAKKVAEHGTKGFATTLAARP